MRIYNDNLQTLVIRENNRVMWRDVIELEKNTVDILTSAINTAENTYEDLKKIKEYAMDGYFVDAGMFWQMELLCRRYEFDLLPWYSTCVDRITELRKMYRNETIKKERVSEKMYEFEKENEEFFHECRKRYLGSIIGKMHDDIMRVRDMRDRHGKMFLLGDDLKDMEKKYKYAYLEYGVLRSGNKKTVKDGGEHSPESIQRARKVPVNDLMPGMVWDAGNGRKRALCPFHDEKNGSLFIFPDNAWHCFGCMAHGRNSIDFIMKLKNMNFKDAVDYLKHF